MLYRFYYDQDGRLYRADQPPPTPAGDVWWDSAATPSGDAVYAALTTGTPDYCYDRMNAAVTQAPVLTVAVTPGANSTLTLAITTHIPSGTSLAPPPSCTLALAGATQTVPLDATGAASVTVTLHGAVANDSHPLALAAAGCVGLHTDLGTPGASATEHQLVVTGAAACTVAPATKAQVRRWLFGTADPDALIDVLTALSHETYGTVSVLLQLVVGILVPTLQNSAYTPLTFTADQQHAVSDLTATVLPTLGETLATIYPATGSRDLVYGDICTRAPGQAQAMAAYKQTLAQFPNLT